ncbi:MAG TPA: efflux RND transporter periplasmic adaptor subunit [Bryobacteraceae bacterium]|nr:efflux RND transporter periplasmic adaptor subunit [Bryobacteraceae bacterium]
MTKSILFFAVCIVGFSGCTDARKHAEEAPPATTAPAASVIKTVNEVHIDRNSPMLSQIHLSGVQTAEVPIDEVDAPGKIEANPNRLSHVVLPLAGRISQVLVKIGDTVQRGQTVLLVESPDADAAISTLLQAEGAVNIATSAALKADADAERARDLFKNSAIAQKEVLSAESVLVQARASVETSKAVREQAARRLAMLGLKPDQYGQKMEVKAPIAGKILELTVAPNEYRNDTNASLMTIADLSDVWVSSDVPETKIRLVKIGEWIGLELSAYPGETFTARVLNIADTVDPATHAIKVHAELKNPNGRFRPEMFGRIRHVESVKRLPMVPVAALVQGEGQTIVYRQKAPGEFERVPVELGVRNGDQVAITSGIKAGDTIVTDGVMLLKEQ